MGENRRIHQGERSMELINRSVRISAPHKQVLAAITTTAGFRAWWAPDCDVGRAAGEPAVFRFRDIEVVFRIDRLDARGLEMTCVRAASFADWQGTHLAIRAVEDGAGTYVDLLHDGFPAKNPMYDASAAGWEQYANSLRTHCETGRGDPFTAKRM
jgi:uncharacterized protein YndB with AHSA1/START domain